MLSMLKIVAFCTLNGKTHYNSLQMTLKNKRQKIINFTTQVAVNISISNCLHYRQVSLYAKSLNSSNK
mgnify:FL=1